MSCIDVSYSRHRKREALVEECIKDASYLANNFGSLEVIPLVLVLWAR